MKRVIKVLVIGLVVSSGLLATEDAKLPCFTVRGRASFYNGTPDLRIWVPATHRMLGSDIDGGETMPDNLKKAFGGQGFDKDVWGIFEVCPYGADVPGEMRLVHIQSAKILLVTE
jgi:hypothetical protein